MAAKFELYKGRDGQYYFRLKAGNGETIAVSEGYTTKASAKNGIASVKKNAPIAETVEVD
ncbi:MAG: YegP family protein [Bacteroidota bacterium]